MINEILYLDLPLLPVDLETNLIKIANEIPADLQGKEWIEEYHGWTIKAASHVYGRSNTFLNHEMTAEIQQLYSGYFGEELIGIVGNLTNTYASGVVNVPPHCDRHRLVSINYILQSGGDDVLTCFYKEGRTGKDYTEAENKQYNEVTLDYKICIPERTWHSYNVQNYHSVENIKGTRLIFSLVLTSNPSFETFRKKYRDLIK